MNKTLFLFLGTGCLSLWAQPSSVKYEEVPPTDLFPRSVIAPQLPPGYKEPDFKGGLIEQGPVGSMMTTKWGNVPAFESLVPGDYYKDTLPETSPKEELLLEQSPLSEVLRQLAGEMGISFVVPPKLEGSITAEYRAMSPTNIFRSILQMNNYQVENYFGAYTLVQRRAPEMIFRRYKLDFNFVDSEDVKTVASTTSTGSGSGSGSGSSGSAGLSSAATIKADYKNFEENIKKLASLKFEDRAQPLNTPSVPTATTTQEPQIVYDADSRVLTVFAAPAAQEAVLTYLETINRPQENVAIEVFVTETALDPKRDLGIDWSFSSGDGFTKDFNIAYNNADSASGDGFEFGRIKLPSVNAAIKALQSDSRARSYSHPRVLTTNNRPVTLESVVEVPYTSSTVSTTPGAGSQTSTNSTDFKRVGISISALPIIQGFDTLRMKVSVQNSTLQGTDEATGQPVTSVRGYGGTFMLQSGEWIVISGLGESQFTASQSGIPYLKNLPFFGRLFESSSERKTSKHLLIFLRPVIKKNIQKGLELDALDKSALSTNFENGKVNFTNDGVYRSTAAMPDPFAKADLQRVIVKLKERQDTLNKSVAVLEDVRTRDIDTRKAEEAEAKARLNALNEELKRDKLSPQEIRELAKAKARASAQAQETSAALKAAEATYRDAMGPVKRELEQINRDLEAKQKALDALLAEERAKFPTSDLIPTGRLEQKNEPKVQAVLGANTDKLVDGTPIFVGARESGQTVLEPKAVKPAPAVPLSAVGTKSNEGIVLPTPPKPAQESVQTAPLPETAPVETAPAPVNNEVKPVKDSPDALFNDL